MAHVPSRSRCGQHQKSDATVAKSLIVDLFVPRYHRSVPDVVLQEVRDRLAAETDGDHLVRGPFDQIEQDWVRAGAFWIRLDERLPCNSGNVSKSTRRSSKSFDSD
jgi:hypothetical protein